MGIDLSLSSTGICIIEEDFFETKKIIHSETLNNKLRGFERWNYIEKKIEKIIEKYEPDIIGIEGYAFKAYRTIDLAELGGIIKKKIYEMGVQVIVFSSSQVRKILTGKGMKPKELDHLDIKEWIIEEIKEGYGIEFTKKQHNEADAFGVAFSVLCLEHYKECFDQKMHQIKPIRFLSEKQIEVLQRLLSTE
jgi:Holliday junction resolvasome RuvABC endonuclease subunit